MLDEYYALRGWDTDGVPKRDAFQSLKTYSYFTITRLFFNAFSIRSSKFDWVRLGYQEYFGSLNFMKIGLEMGSTSC